MFDANHIYTIAKLRRDAGRLPQAEQLLVALLNQAPDHLDAAYLLAEIALERGRSEKAFEILSKIATFAPDRGDVLEKLGRAHLELGRIEEAWTCLTRAESLCPEKSEVQKNLCIAARHKNNIQEALYRGEAAVRLAPHDALAHAVLGDVYLDLGRPSDALSAYGRSLGLDPDNWRVLLKGAEAYLLLGQPERAEHSLALANLLDPGNPSILAVLCSLMIDLGRLDQASSVTQQLAAIVPEHPKVLFFEGLIALRRGHPRHAVGALIKALAKDETDLQTASQLAEALLRDGKTEQSAELLGRIIKNAPDALALRVQMIKALLVDGKTNIAMEQLHQLQQKISLPWKAPLLSDGDLSGKTVLLYSLLGTQELLRFLPYVGCLKERGARVVVHCAEPLRPLIESIEEVHSSCSRVDDGPSVDYHAPFELLPELLGTSLDPMGDRPKLEAAADLREAWALKLPKTQKPKVGLMWRRETDVLPNAYESVPLSNLSPLWTRDDVEWISFQAAAGLEELEDFPHKNRLHLIDLDNAPGTDRLAALENIDLLISADTLTAHIASAAGLPVWIMASTTPVWHWSKDGPGSTPRPTTRLFRQKQIADWTPVIDEIGRELAKHLGGPGSPDDSRP